jgi:large subunit ribosomal protein L24
MARIHKSDQVIVLTGKDKGKRGTVLRVLDDGHVVVEGVNRVKKHQKPNPMRNQQGGVVEKEMPIQASNVALFNMATQKADRVGYKVLEDGRKVRVYKSNGEMVDAQG